MINIIKDYFDNNGICEWGICSAEPFENTRKILCQQNSRLKGFVEQNIEKRIYPQKTLSDAKSIIVAALPYNKKYSFNNDNILRGKMSMGAVGLDYHTSLKKILNGLVERLLCQKSFNYAVFVDTGPLLDREIAIRAGIGSYGKNGAVITKNNGSTIFIGYILTSLELPISKPKNNICNNCLKCIRNCPTNALSENGFDFKKCISYLTQKKGILEIYEMKSMGMWLYGCDMCQINCISDAESQIITDIDCVMPSIKEILSMTNKSFKVRFGNTAAGWRGLKNLKRNALIVLGNTHSYEALDILYSFKNNTDNVLAETAIRAIAINRKEL